ncbi:MAG: DUF6291 domain-containing protein [Oscillospiraceae bacterium]
MAKESRPTWFKMFRNQKALIDSVPDETAGRALKAIFQYFENGEVVNMPPLEFAVFSSVKPYVDESFDDFERGKKQMSYTRWKGLHPNGTIEEFEEYYRTKNDVP